jgi:oligopeptide/dipeptide ABC transporter ATP-binding protein
MVEPTAHLVEARDVVRNFPVGRTLFGRSRRLLRAVDGVSLAIRRGETMGLVGESGCGKSTLGRLLIRTLEPDAGEIRFDGQDISHLDRHRMRPLRRRVQMVFQDPMGSLDPRMRVGDSVAEPLRIAGGTNRQQRRERAREMLELVGLAGEHANRYPHEFSGGQRQRICIARALVLRPDFIVADEPVSALDVSVRAQVINLLVEVQARFGLTYLFVSHDLGVVRHIADTVAVMYLGRIVEQGPGRVILSRPLHPYTQALLAAAPPPRPHRNRQRSVIEGDLPSPLNPPPGCPFHTRCPLAADRCTAEAPLLRPAADDRFVACHLV